MSIYRLLTSFFLFVVLILQSHVANAQAGGMLVGVDAVKSEPLKQTVPVLGRMVALRTGNVAARIAGYVDDMKVNVGDKVVKGQVLAILGVESLKADIVLAESELFDAKAVLATQQAQAEVSRTELRRQKGLKSSVAFSQAKFEDAEKKLAVSLAEVERAKAQVQIKQASLKKAKLNLAYATVKAPYNGVVVQEFTEQGVYLRIGDPIVKLIDPTSLEIEADVPATRISGLEFGASVSFTLADGNKYNSKVRAVLPSENSLTRTRTVRFTPDFKGKRLVLAEGQSATLHVPAGEQRQILTISKDAILKRGGADIVYLVKDNKALPKPVKLGEGTNGRIEVIEGLKAGDQVVVRGNERLFPGVSVKIGKGGS